MPAVDEELARDLVAILDANPSIEVNNIEFTWDAYHELDRVQTEILYVTPNRYVHQRLARDEWQKISIINFVFLAPVEVNVDEQSTSDWVEKWDVLTDLGIKAARPLGIAATLFEQEERFSVAELQNRRRLMFEAAATYPLRV